ncbi:MAG: hypothetical protein K8T90_17875 [Planctomycetes bacterium]|nr:hypothetical protein [Planctomycetota bacterium]
MLGRISLLVASTLDFAISAAAVPVPAVQPAFEGDDPTRMGIAQRDAANRLTHPHAG